jgi:urease alpha subunit
MAKCGCSGSTCGCKIQGSGGVTVTGIGTATDPYVLTLGAVDIGAMLVVNDSTSIDFTMTGDGTALDPLVLTGVVNPGATATATPTNASNTAIASTTRLQVLDHVATIASGTVTLPASSTALEKEVKIIALSEITALTVAGAVGTTVAGMPTTLAANAYFRAQLIGTVWRRIG